MPVKNPVSKDRIRSFYLDKRKNISEADLIKWNRSIFDHVVSHTTYINSTTVHIYAPLKQNKEVDTSKIIQHALENGKQVVVPKMMNSRFLNHYFIRSLAELTPNKWGIPEPKGGVEAEMNQMDLVIVPMVAGDKSRNRLGYGKGYYDRFLADCNATKIGLLFDLQLHPVELPVEPYDIPLDILITEYKVI